MSAALTKQLPRVGLKAPPAEIEFRGLFKARLLLGNDDRRRVLPAELAESLGADGYAAKKRAKRSFLKGCAMMASPSAGGVQEVLALDLRYVPAFLLGFQPSRCRRAIRPRLEEIQDELSDALAAYTFEGVAVNPAFGPPALPAGLTADKVRALIRAETPAPAFTLDDVRILIRGERARVLVLSEQRASEMLEARLHRDEDLAALNTLLDEKVRAGVESLRAELRVEIDDRVHDWLDTAFAANSGDPATYYGLRSDVADMFVSLLNDPNDDEGVRRAVVAVARNAWPRRSDEYDDENCRQSYLLQSKEVTTAHGRRVLEAAEACATLNSHERRLLAVLASHCDEAGTFEITKGKLGNVSYARLEAKGWVVEMTPSRGARPATRAVIIPDVLKAPR